MASAEQFHSLGHPAKAAGTPCIEAEKGGVWEYGGEHRQPGEQDFQVCSKDEVL